MEHNCGAGVDPLRAQVPPMIYDILSCSPLVRPSDSRSGRGRLGGLNFKKPTSNWFCCDIATILYPSDKAIN